MRTRFILSFTLVVLIAVSAVVVFIRRDNQRQLQSYMLQGGMVGAEDLVQALQQFYQENGSWNGVAEMLNQHRPGMMAGGRRSGMQGMHSMLMGAASLYDPQGQLVAAQNNSAAALLSEAQRDAAIRLEAPSGEAIGYLWVEGQGSLRRGSEQPLLQRMNAAAVQAGLLGLGLALVVALLLSAGLLRPVRQLTTAAQKMAAGDLSQRVPETGAPELATMAASFNRLAESLQQSEQQRQAMTADIAHELRTPLSVQRAHLEALQDGVYPLTLDGLQPVLEQNALLNRLIEDLRLLALSDAGELRLERVSVDLVELTADVLEQFRPAAERRNIQLNLDWLEQTHLSPVDGDALRIRQILNNLLSNALRHAPQDGRIEVGLGADERFALLTVHDNGEGFSTETLAHLFERFYRSDRSRSREAGGTGLGLTIARQLARAMGGDLTAENHPQGGAFFRLTLPLVKTQP